MRIHGNDYITRITRSDNRLDRFEVSSRQGEQLRLAVLEGLHVAMGRPVYRRLFEKHPEAEGMFRSEGSAPVKGSMLALTIEAILDFAGERTGHFRLIECEVSSHDAYGTPRDLFISFFGVIADTLHEIIGADWTPEIDAATPNQKVPGNEYLAVPDTYSPSAPEFRKEFV